MKLNNKKGFTLVELIVVITILAILSAIGFVAYSWYLSWVRDSSRLTQLEWIHKALKVYSSKRIIPMPLEKIDIIASGSIIWHQWIFGEVLLEAIKYNKWWMDPLEKTYFSYYISSDRKYFQLMWFFEENNLVTWNFNNSFASTQYFIKHPYVTWNKLGILVWWSILNLNTPIDKIITNTGSYDISSTNSIYKGIISNKQELIWTGSVLIDLYDVVKAWWRWYNIDSTWSLIFTDLSNL